MFRSICRVGTSVVQRGRIKHAFAASVALALVVIPTITALAYYAATGSGVVPNVQGATAASTVTLINSNAPTYAGPSTTSLAPGGTVSFGVLATCTAGCPAQVSTINLSAWISDKAGCTEAAMPGSFTMPTITYNGTATTTGTVAGTAVITFVNLASDQSACSAAHFSFTLVTPAGTPAP